MVEADNIAMSIESVHHGIELMRHNYDYLRIYYRRLLSNTRIMSAIYYVHCLFRT